MSINFLGAGLSSLQASQVALNTITHNIANAGVEGYHRQRVVLAAKDPQFLGGGFIGKGVDVAGVDRLYSQFLDRQWRESAGLSAHLDRLSVLSSQVDGLLADNSASLSPALQEFFAAFSGLSDSPTSVAQRQLVFSTASTLMGRFASIGSQLDGIGRGVEESIRADVSQINAYASEIANLNGLISQYPDTGSAGAPNDLLDRRDQAVFALTKLIGVNTVVNGDGTLNVVAGNGQALVVGAQAYQLAAVPDPADQTRLKVVYKPGGTLVDIPESFLLSGELGADLAFRSQTLEYAQGQLGRLATVLTDQINAIHRQGFGLDGIGNRDLFTPQTGERNALASTLNGSAAAVRFSIADSQALTGQDYRLEFVGASGMVRNWRLTRADGAVVPLVEGAPAMDGSIPLQPTGSPAVDGLSIRIAPGTSASPGDRFTLQPVRGVITNLALATQDIRAIAAASTSPVGPADGTNARKLADLQRTPLVAGNATLAEAFAQMVGSIGVQTSTARSRSQAQSILTSQLSQQQQSFSGVNLDEEASEMLRYQQAYQASAKLISIADKLFSSVLEL